MHYLIASLFFFFNDTATTEIYTLSLHDALPISFTAGHNCPMASASSKVSGLRARSSGVRDRKSTRLNSSHGYISYAVFCLKKKKRIQRDTIRSRRRSSELLLATSTS